MIALLSGAPVGPDVPTQGAQREFDHIPHLRDLLPSGGWPGVTYVQACVHNVARAKERVERPANLRTIRGTEYYEIVGPRGRASMALVGCGVPIPGASPDAGDRLCFTDGEVEALTGHAPKYPIWFRPQPEEKPGEEIQVTQGSDRPSQGAHRDEGVSTRELAQRQRRDREKQEAGSSNRP